MAVAAAGRQGAKGHSHVHDQLAPTAFDSLKTNPETGPPVSQEPPLGDPLRHAPLVEVTGPPPKVGKAGIPGTVVTAGQVQLPAGPVAPSAPSWPSVPLNPRGP